MDRRNVALAFLARGALVALLVTLLPALATADRHKAGFGGGAAYDGRSDLWGIRMTGDWTWKEGKTSLPSPGGHASRWILSFVGEISQVAGEHEGSNFSQTTLLVGVRYTLNELGSHLRVEPFAEALVGGAYERDLDSRVSAVGGFGAGIDFVPFGRMTEVEHHPLVVLRGQWDRLWINGDSTDSYNQFTASVVFRLTRKK
jgi:hypothetical protein